MTDIDSTLCDEALRIVNGDRREAYGTPERNFHRIALAWEALTDRPYTESEVALMFVALKIVRQSHKPQRDNIVDGIGYLLCGDAVTEKEEVCTTKCHGIWPLYCDHGRSGGYYEDKPKGKVVDPENDLTVCVDVGCVWRNRSVPYSHEHQRPKPLEIKPSYTPSFPTHPAAEPFVGVMQATSPLWQPRNLDLGADRR